MSLIIPETSEKTQSFTIIMDAKRCLFLAINCIFMLFGIAIAVIGLWLPDSNDPGLQIQTIFDECFIAFGLTLFLIGLCGALGVANNNPVLLRCFMTMMIILLLTQLSVVIYAVLASTSSVFGALVWNSLGDGFRDQIQISLRCCGFNSSPEMDVPEIDSPEIDQLPQSCFDPDTSEVFSDPCNKALWEFIARDQSDMFYLVILIVFLQMLQIAISMSLIKDTVKQNEDKLRLLLASN